MLAIKVVHRAIGTRGYWLTKGDPRSQRQDAHFETRVAQIAIFHFRLLLLLLHARAMKSNSVGGNETRLWRYEKEKRGIKDGRQDTEGKEK